MINFGHETEELEFKKNAKNGKKKSTNIWSTHPSTADRIEALRNLK